MLLCTVQNRAKWNRKKNKIRANSNKFTLAFLFTALNFCFFSLLLGSSVNSAKFIHWNQMQIHTQKNIHGHTQSSQTISFLLINHKISAEKLWRVFANEKKTNSYEKKTHFSLTAQKRKMNVFVFKIKIESALRWIKRNPKLPANLNEKYSLHCSSSSLMNK